MSGTRIRTALGLLACILAICVAARWTSETGEHDEHQPEQAKESAALGRAATVAVTPVATDAQGAQAAIIRFADKQSSLPARMPHGLAEQAVRLHPADVEMVVSVLRDRNDDQAIRNEALNLLRGAHWAPLALEIGQLLERADETERFRAFLAQHLGCSIEESPGDSEALRLLKDLLNDRHEVVRREALWALVRVRDPQVSSDN